MTRSKGTPALRRSQGGAGGGAPAPPRRPLASGELRPATGYTSGALRPAPTSSRRPYCGASQGDSATIITVTTNAAVDKTLTVPNFQVGFRHRASESLTLPGGKGVNIARALKNLEQPVVATGLIGGRAGQLIVGGLARENVLSDFVRIGGESRTSTAVVDPTTMTQTEVIEYGPVVSATELESLLDKVEYLAKGANAVVLAGSLPRKVPEDFYATLMQRLRPQRCYVVLDSAGEPLRLGIRGRPHLVTPNVREAEDLVGHEFHDEQDMADATGMIVEMGARNVIIKTPHGCVARFTRGRRARVYRASIEPLERVLSTVGSGDAFLAGFLSARFDKRELPDALRLALASGTANTLRYGAGVLDRGDVHRLLETAEAIELEDAPAPR